MTKAIYAPTTTGTYTAFVYVFSGTALMARSSVTFTVHRAVVPPSAHKPFIHVKAVVLHKQLMASGRVMVTLSAVSTAVNRPTVRPLRYRWDFTNDGVIETPLSAHPMTKAIYAPTTTGTYTAFVYVFSGTALMARSSVTFTVHRAVV
jgi:hypothetical protein